MKKQLKKLRRSIYDLRRFVPGLSFQHRAERMVGPVGFWKELGRYQFNVLSANGLQREHSVLDLGCGPLQGGIPLIQYLAPAKYTGVDINPDHVDAARTQVSRHRLEMKQPRLIQSENFGEEAFKGDKFDFIWASQILYYFDDQKMSRVLAFARKRLTAGGKFLGDFINPDRYESIVYPNCNFVHHTVEELQRIAVAEGIKVRPVGYLTDYEYPKQLRLNSSLMMEFSLEEYREAA